MLSKSNAEMLIHAFMTSRLDYCNALLGGCSECLINKLQMVQNAAARVLTRTRKYDHISPVLSTLQWLPTKHRIDFKILLITSKALNGLCAELCRMCRIDLQFSLNLLFCMSNQVRTLILKSSHSPSSRKFI